MVPLQIVPKQRMIFVTGPAAAGRAALLDQVMKQVDREINDKIIADAADAAAAKKKKNSNNSNNKNDVDVPKKRFRIGKLLTSNEAYKTSSSGAAAASSWYEYISASALQELRDSGDVLFEGVDRDANGNIIDVSVLDPFHYCAVHTANCIINSIYHHRFIDLIVLYLNRNVRWCLRLLLQRSRIASQRQSQKMTLLLRRSRRSAPRSNRSSPRTTWYCWDLQLFLTKSTLLARYYRRIFGFQFKPRTSSFNRHRKWCRNRFD